MLSPSITSSDTSSSTRLALADSLETHTAEGSLFTLEEGAVRCVACAHRCKLRPGQSGICRVRFNLEGTLRVPFGYVAGLQCDPVEKKPFYHWHPGSQALTFGMLGCNFHCDFCQNWLTSQALRDLASETPTRKISPQQLIQLARTRGARSLVSSYNEPLITAEWAAEIFRPALAAGLECAVVSNGHATPEVLDYLGPWLTSFKVDLKCFDERKYLRMGGKLRAVMETIREIKRRGIWLETVTLLIPGLNDEESELRALTEFIASVDPLIPWHVTAFHPDYRRTNARATRADDLSRALAIGKASGLRYIYAGNLPGQIERSENTYCHHCGVLLVAREGYCILSNRIPATGHCPECQHQIPGRWA